MVINWDCMYVLEGDKKEMELNVWTVKIVGKM